MKTWDGIQKMEIESSVAHFGSWEVKYAEKNKSHPIGQKPRRDCNSDAACPAVASTEDAVGLVSPPSNRGEAVSIPIPIPI